MKSVLFICTANLCRSPLAAAIFTSLCQADISDWSIASAGTWTRPGQPVPQYLQKLALSYGLDLSKHRSRQVNFDLLRQFALVLVMEPGHKEALRVEVPDQAPKVYLLSELVGLSSPLVDPLGLGLREIAQVIKVLNNWLTDGKDRIRDLAEEPGRQIE
jgi:protein-tyrosine-phosphatase